MRMSFRQPGSAPGPQAQRVARSHRVEAHPHPRVPRREDLGFWLFPGERRLLASASVAGATRGGRTQESAC